MQVNMSTDNHPNFGQLYIHKGLRFSKMYRYNSDIVNFIQEDLKELAKDVDIHVQCRNILEKGFDVTVSNVVKSPVKRFLGLIGVSAGRSIRPENCQNVSIVETLLNNVKGAKEDYCRKMAIAKGELEENDN